MCSNGCCDQVPLTIAGIPLKAESRAVLLCTQAHSTGRVMVTAMGRMTHVKSCRFRNQTMNFVACRIANTTPSFQGATTLISIAWMSSSFLFVTLKSYLGQHGTLPSSAVRAGA